MPTTTTPSGALLVALDQIHVPANVRELDHAHVDALAGSIALQGMLVPVILTQTDATDPGARFLLVAGFHRVAAAHKLGLTELPAVIRDTELQAADRAVENIARLALDPYQQAVAVKAMLERGLSEDGAAQALGWPRQRVAARMKLLELPERAQQMVGAGTIALSAVDQLRAIKDASPELLDAVIDYLADGNEHLAERLSTQPGWVIDAALRPGRSGVFAAHLSRLDIDEIAALKLGKKSEQLLEQATALHKQIDRYSYGAPAIRFNEQDVDQARAAGVLVEFDASAPIITDRPYTGSCASRRSTAPPRSCERRPRPSSRSARPPRPPARSRLTPRRRPGASAGGRCARWRSRRTARTSTSAGRYATSSQPSRST